MYVYLISAYSENEGNSGIHYWQKFGYVEFYPKVRIEM